MIVSEKGGKTAFVEATCSFAMAIVFVVIKYSCDDQSEKKLEAAVKIKARGLLFCVGWFARQQFQYQWQPQEPQLQQHCSWNDLH